VGTTSVAPAAKRNRFPAGTLPAAAAANHSPKSVNTSTVGANAALLLPPLLLRPPAVAAGGALPKLTLRLPLRLRGPLSLLPLRPRVAGLPALPLLPLLLLRPRGALPKLTLRLLLRLRGPLSLLPLRLRGAATLGGSCQLPLGVAVAVGLELAGALLLAAAAAAKSPAAAAPASTGAAAGGLSSGALSSSAGRPPAAGFLRGGSAAEVADETTGRATALGAAAGAGVRRRTTCIRAALMGSGPAAGGWSSGLAGLRAMGAAAEMESILRFAAGFRTSLRAVLACAKSSNCSYTEKIAYTNILRQEVCLFTPL
jgi:hypothetical protein